MALYPLDLWTVFVVYTFGSFWMAVIGLAAVYLFILAILGKVSMYSNIWFLVMFFVCMAVGYGYLLVTVPLVLFIVIRFVMDIIGIIGRSRV